MDSRLWFLHIISRMANNSFTGMLLYILEISSDAIFRPRTHGMSVKSFINYTELRTLHAYGSGMYVFSVFMNIFARLYEMFLKVIIGRMGVSSLYTLVCPLKTGVPGFRFMYRHLLSALISFLHSFIVILRSS